MYISIDRLCSIFKKNKLPAFPHGLYVEVVVELVVLSVDVVTLSVLVIIWKVVVCLDKLLVVVVLFSVVSVAVGFQLGLSDVTVDMEDGVMVSPATPKKNMTVSPKAGKSADHIFYKNKGNEREYVQFVLNKNGMWQPSRSV